jgi:trans-4-hydroxy-L-proline dehydratase
MHRTELLRERTLQRQQRITGRHRLHPAVDAASLKSTESIASWQVRTGIRVRDRLASLRFEIDELELLAGRTSDICCGQAELAQAEAYLAGYPGSPGQTGHCQPDYEVLFSTGIDVLRGQIRLQREQAETTETTDSTESAESTESTESAESQKILESQEALDFYQSCLYALDGFQIMIEHAADMVEEALVNATGPRRDELGEIMASCRRIAHAKPETFRDAIQLLWFVMLGHMSGDGVWLVGPGRLDRVLLPYHRPENRELELELIEALYLLINDYDLPGLAYAVMVGGCDGDGRDAGNELSFLAMEAIRRTRLVYPTVGLCHHPGTSDELMELTVGLVADGYATPAFFNDATISSGLRKYGVPPHESHDYINSTCVEITPTGCSNVWVASPYFSLCGMLMEQIDDAVAVNRRYPDFDIFLEEYFERMNIKIAEAVKTEAESRELRRLYGRKPLQSLFTRDCLSRGHDIDDGGARYNWVECSFVSAANLVDSLEVIRRMVIGEGRLTFHELKRVLDADFAGNEALRLELLAGNPKYGNNIPETDVLMRKLVDRIQTECARYRLPPDDAPFVPGMFCWIMHQRLGAECRATPDGRKAGFPFADGSGPAQGREMKGPTAAIMSVTSWDHSGMIGGIAYNMKFDKSLFSSQDMRRKLRFLIETYLDRGGFETQINVLDNGILAKAMENPEAYRDLVVRIGGYTDYFTHLSPGMQAEVMQRTAFMAL